MTIQPNGMHFSELVYELIEQCLCTVKSGDIQKAYKNVHNCLITYPSYKCYMRLFKIVEMIFLSERNK